VIEAGAGLAVNRLDAWYGQAQVLRQVTVAVAHREVVGLFGHNGAGKTTLLRSIARVHRQTSGDIRWDSLQLDTMRTFDVARRGVRLVREGARVFDTMSVEDQLILGARLSRRPRGVVLSEVFELFPILRDRLRVFGGYLSGGQRQMLAIAVALAGDPICLLLDEPSTGLAHGIVAQLYETLRALADRGVALLIAEQTSTHLAAISERGYLLETGEIRASGPPSTFLTAAASAGSR
jgi:branched-chain amino acid transport system ATP-binding protein